MLGMCGVVTKVVLRVTCSGGVVRGTIWWYVLRGTCYRLDGG